MISTKTFLQVCSLALPIAVPASALAQMPWPFGSNCESVAKAHAQDKPNRINEMFTKSTPEQLTEQMVATGNLAIIGYVRAIDIAKAVSIDIQNVAAVLVQKNGVQTHCKGEASFAAVYIPRSPNPNEAKPTTVTATISFEFIYVEDRGPRVIESNFQDTLIAAIAVQALLVYDRREAEERRTSEAAQRRLQEEQRIRDEAKRREQEALRQRQADDLVGQLRSKMRDCISIPRGTNRDAPIAIRVRLSRDGGLTAPPQLISGERAVGEAVIRGIRACAPYRFPERFTTRYDEWRDVVITIDVNELN